MKTGGLKVKSWLNGGVVRDDDEEEGLGESDADGERVLRLGGAGS